MAELAQELESTTDQGFAASRLDVALNHAMWLVSRSLLALILILLANWLQVPVDKFLELERETNARQREVEGALQAAREGNEILKKAELATAKFERTVLLARSTNLQDSNDRQRLANLVSEAEAATDVLSTSYGNALVIPGEAEQGILGLIQTLERALEALKTSTLRPRDDTRLFSYEADLQRARGYLRSIKAEITIAQKDMRSRWIKE